MRLSLRLLVTVPLLLAVASSAACSGAGETTTDNAALEAGTPADAATESSTAPKEAGSSTPDTASPPNCRIVSSYVDRKGKYEVAFASVTFEKASYVQIKKVRFTWGANPTIESSFGPDVKNSYPGSDVIDVFVTQETGASDVGGLSVHFFKEGGNFGSKPSGRIVMEDTTSVSVELDVLRDGVATTLKCGA